MMAKLKRGKISEDEARLIRGANGAGASIRYIAGALNRSEKVVQKFLEENTESISPIERDPTSIPDPPKPLPVGHAKKYFEIEDSKNPGKKRKGMAVMTEGGSEAGDDFSKSDASIAPMSSRYNNCIAKASND